MDPGAPGSSRRRRFRGPALRRGGPGGALPPVPGRRMAPVPAAGAVAVQHPRYRGLRLLGPVQDRPPHHRATAFPVRSMDHGAGERLLRGRPSRGDSHPGHRQPRTPAQGGRRGHLLRPPPGGPGHRRLLPPQCQRPPDADHRVDLPGARPATAGAHPLFRARTPPPRRGGGMGERGRPQSRRRDPRRPQHDAVHTLSSWPVRPGNFDNRWKPGVRAVHYPWRIHHDFRGSGHPVLGRGAGLSQLRGHPCVPRRSVRRHPGAGRQHSVDTGRIRSHRGVLQEIRDRPGAGPFPQNPCSDRPGSSR